MVDKEGEILTEQKGIIRSNKLLSGPEIFEFSAARLGAITSTECISTFSEDLGIYKACMNTNL
nr:phosphoinositide phosphatase SAC8 isoform X2 [Ipomoea trifida]